MFLDAAWQVAHPNRSTERLDQRTQVDDESAAVEGGRSPSVARLDQTERVAEQSAEGVPVEIRSRVFDLKDARVRIEVPDGDHAEQLQHEQTERRVGTEARRHLGFDLRLVEVVADGTQTGDRCAHMDECLFQLDDDVRESCVEFEPAHASAQGLFELIDLRAQRSEVDRGQTDVFDARWQVPSQ